jgi:aspartyl-tRNA(Asn)/glutamyl-tRNA(Gln) amidotransferase subunit A
MTQSIWPKLATLAEFVNNGSLSAVSQVEKALSEIERNNDEYNAVISVTSERAHERALAVDRLISDGKNAGKLAGIPFLAKDNFLAFGADTTAASNMLKGFKAPYQATVIERLEAEGAICVGKANMDAFAHGGSTENSDFGVTKNPHDTSRVPGGSSGGSAAAVALGMVPFALGSDTGGSIRQPASFCGVVGYKPTYGVVSRSGVVAMASSTDCMGPLTNTIDDAALVMSCIAGQDPLDSTTLDSREIDFAAPAVNLKGKKVGVVKEWFEAGLDESVKTTIETSINKLREVGAVIEEVSLPSLPLALAIYYVVVPAELSSNLSRHDGQRYQYAAENASTLNEMYVRSRSEGFGAEAKRRIMIGTHVLSSGYYDAYYKKAQTVRTKLINEFNEAFRSHDFLVGPVAPTTAFKIGENEEPLQMYLQDIYCVGASLVGVPALSLPCGTSNGLPVGLQIVASQKRDGELLAFAKSLEASKVT